MQFAKNTIESIELPRVHVFLDILEIHSYLVDLSVLKIKIVLGQKFVKIKNVSTLVQDYVALMQSVMYKTILLAVIVCKDILEILQWLVTKYLHLQVSFDKVE